MASRYCNLCGGRLKGSFYTYDLGQKAGMGALVVCADCHAAAPRCRFCARPMAGQLAHHGVCVTCMTTHQRCHSCGLPVSDGIEMQDGSGRVFCQTCVQTLPACLACSAPVDSSGHALADGRHRCHLCNVSAIDDPGQAQKLYDDVQSIAAQQLGLTLSIPTPLVLVDPAQLRAVLQMIGDAHPPEARPPRGVYARKGMKRGIYVESGLPRVQMIGVIAHELGHAWQTERKPLMNDPLLVEGFAEWVAYKVFLSLGDSAAMSLMTARSDIYGQGLRQVLSWQLDDPNAVLDRSGR